MLTRIFHHKAEVLSKDQWQRKASALESLGEEDGVPVYFSAQDDAMHALYPVAAAEYYLIVSDRAETEAGTLGMYDSQHRQDRIIRLAVVGALVGFFTFLAWGLLYALNRLARYVMTLSRVNQQFAEGHLHARVEADMPAPFDQLAASYNAMAARIQESIADQEVMSHAIAHELRTPLTRLQLAVSLAGSRNADPAIAPLLASMDEYIDELDGLSDAILTLAKINHRENAVLSSERFDLTALLQARVGALTPVAGKRIDGPTQGPIAVWADPFFMQLALDNLLTNAIRHCASVVKVAVCSEPDGSVCVVVEDDGEGISEADRLRVFLPFSRLDTSRDRKSGGHGLGLAIVHSVASRHQGTVVVSRSDLQGAGFVFRLPSVAC